MPARLRSTGIGTLCAALLTGCGGITAEDSEAHGPYASPTTEGLVSVWGSTANDVWAVGQAGTIIHFDGEEWRLVDSSTKRDLFAVTGTSADDVWISGDNVILHCGSSTCTVVLTDLFELLLGAYMSGPNDLWLSGYATDVNRGVLRHWDGADWLTAPTSEGRLLWEIWGTGPEDVWVGGSHASHDGFLNHGGYNIDFVPTGFEGGVVRGIWGSNANDVWVATYESAIHHWDGTGWTQVPANGAQHLTRLGGAGADVWAVGYAGTALHWDGRSWVTTATPAPAENLRSVWAIDPNDVWAVGGHGTLMHWDGGAWR